MSDRSTREMRLMKHAYIEQEQSTCDRNHVGCVIARDRRIIATGYNGAPAGMAHCEHPSVPTFQAVTPYGVPEPLNPYEWPPLREKGCKVSVHAEANALAFAARHGMATDGTDLYTTLSPCYECAKLIINAGISRVIFDRNYRDRTGLELLAAGGVIVTWIGALKG